MKPSQKTPLSVQTIIDSLEKISLFSFLSIRFLIDHSFVFFCIFCNIFSHNYLSIYAAAGIPCGVCITLNVVSMMTLLWASLAQMRV